MDLEKKEFFQQQYQDFDDEGISDLLAKRDSLVEEAIAALETIAQERNVAIPSAIAPQALIPADNEAKAKELSKSSLAIWVGMVFIGMLSGPVSTLRWGALPVLVAGLIGWAIYHQITESIFSNENLHHEEMKAKLWEMLKGGLIGWVLLTFVAVALKS